jgi:hypothetical protein
LPAPWVRGRPATRLCAASVAHARTGTTRGSTPSTSTPWTLFSTARTPVCALRCTR